MITIKLDRKKQNLLMRDGWGKRRGNAGFVYIEEKWSANLSLKKPRLDADRTVSGRLFLFALGIEDITNFFRMMVNERVPNKIGIMQVVYNLYKRNWLVLSE